jgi:hypothetical protein
LPHPPSPQTEPNGREIDDKLTDKEQSERFTEADWKLGVDESGERFEKAFGAILTERDEKSSRQKS